MSGCCFFGSGFICPNYGQGAAVNDQAADEDESAESSEILERSSESATSLSDIGLQPLTEAALYGTPMPPATPPPPADDELQPPAASSGNPQAEQ